MPRTRIFWSASVAESWPPLPWRSGLKGRDLLSASDLTPAETDFLLQLALRVKAHPLRYRDALAGKSLAMLFEKPSLRTRVTFELAMTQLGGRALYLGPDEVGLGKREAVKDVAGDLSRWGGRGSGRGVSPPGAWFELARLCGELVSRPSDRVDQAPQRNPRQEGVPEHKGRLA